MTTTDAETTKQASSSLLLMNRLKSQFGDMDLSHLHVTDEDEDEEDGHDDKNDINLYNDSSSLEEPSPEELQAWQAKQFAQGEQRRKEHEESKTKKWQSAIQRRREHLRKAHDGRNSNNNNNNNNNSNSNNKNQEEDEWEQVPPLPQLHKEQSSVFFPTTDRHGNEIIGVHPLLQQLSKGDVDILGTNPWLRLYSSTAGDGLSFVRFLDKIRGYEGPTVMILGVIPSPSKSTVTNSGSASASGRTSSTTSTTTTTTTTTIGFYTTSPWVESATMTGTSECFLFAMDEDKVHFFKPLNDNNNIGGAPTANGYGNGYGHGHGHGYSYDTSNGNHSKKQRPTMYLHPSTLTLAGRHNRRSKAGMTMTTTTTTATSTDGFKHGLGIGGTPSQPRLYITETFEECRAMDFCHLFEAGDLLLGHGSNSLNFFDVDAMEVWAVGGSNWIADCIQVQERQRSIYQSTQHKIRKVDNAQFLQDFFQSSSGGILGSHNKLFQHTQHTTGRCDL